MRFYWERAPGRRAGRYGNPGELLCCVARSLGFHGDGIRSGLSLADHSDSESSWWCTPCSAKMDAREEDSGRWLDMWCRLKTAYANGYWCMARVGGFNQCAFPNTSNEYSGLSYFRIAWFDLRTVQGSLKSLLQHHSSKASILRHSVFFIVQFSHSYMTTGKTITLTRRTFVR